ncbi:SusD/RagB family nutrient-binding outer membrane lipoprotein [Apibacter sp. HY039]|uniref:SusD/RagB family nutrient-binding outer membrane lipoprotein n=1 Tax=Apibacter sp. HY039 TaxID=2501476 RepID=UPI000FEC0798|nr:SusD/RagB family nutrient-binding outer membrane lipoprotein [Apibacter sp. HY039]
MKNIKIYIFLLSISFSISGCNNVDDYQDDPNRVIHVSPDFLLPGIQVSAFKNIDDRAALASRHLAYINGLNVHQYYNWQRGSFQLYDNIKQVEKMVEEAGRSGSQVYVSLARFYKAYYFVSLTETFGDIPYSEAVKQGVSYPKYDTQKSIYKNVLEELKAANLELSTVTNQISGDIIYGGDVLKWRKLINSYRLRILMDLSKRSEDTTLNVKQSFAEIIDNPSENPIMESHSDSGLLNFYNQANNRYPYFNSNELKTAFYMEQSFVDKLKLYKDPRLFKIAEKKTNLAGIDNSDPFSYYDGLYGSGDLGANSEKASSGLASRIHPRYFDDPVNEPGILMGYAELQFILAEAAFYGWINRDVNTCYVNGIKASMNFYHVENSDVETYLEQPVIKLQSGNILEQIMNQKHIALFFNTGWQIFYDQRRTGFPKFNTDGSGALNGRKIPQRWMYPSSEITNNNTNLANAITSQYPGGDDSNGVMWILK